MEVTKFWPLVHSGGRLLVAVKVASNIFVNLFNATKLKSSETQLQFQFELSLAQLVVKYFQISSNMTDIDRYCHTLSVTIKLFNQFSILSIMVRYCWVVRCF